MATFGQRLSTLREEKGLLQKELAILLNVTISTISNYENGIHYPDHIILSKLADFFEVTTDYLLARTDYRHDPETLNNYITKDYTIAQYVNTTLELNPADISKVIEYIDLLKVRYASNTPTESEPPSPS